MDEKYTAEKGIVMSKRNEKRSARNRNGARKILRARYHAKTHFAAFDICPIRLDGKRARPLRRGTLQGANRKEITKMLTRVAETFACRELHLERVGGRKAAGTFVEIIRRPALASGELNPAQFNNNSVPASR
jgi:hypothetical protein